MSGLDEVGIKECPECSKKYPSFYISLADGSRDGILNLEENIAESYGVINSEIEKTYGLEWYLDSILYIVCSNCKHKIRDKTLIRRTVYNRMEELELAA